MYINRFYCTLLLLPLLTWPACVHSQRTMLERASIADAPRLEPVSRRLELVNTGLEPANLGTFSARQLSDAAISLAPNIQSTLALQERTDRQALEEGITK